jgi:hypothetical protein
MMIAEKGAHMIREDAGARRSDTASAADLKFLPRLASKLV